MLSSDKSVEKLKSIAMQFSQYSSWWNSQGHTSHHIPRFCKVSLCNLCFITRGIPVLKTLWWTGLLQKVIIRSRTKVVLKLKYSLLITKSLGTSHVLWQNLYWIYSFKSLQENCCPCRCDRIIAVKDVARNSNGHKKLSAVKTSFESTIFMSKKPNYSPVS